MMRRRSEKDRADIDEDGVTGQEEGSSSPEQRPSAFVVQVTAIAGLGGILFGYDLGVISGALPQVAQAFALSNQQQELVVSILYVGGALGAAMGGSICDMFGRKQAILITDVVFLIGGVLLYAAPSFTVLLVGRIVVGFGVAVSGIADVAYLHEIAPTQWRGSIVSVNEACISLGFLLAFVVATLLSGEGNTSGWRLMFGLSGVLAMIQFYGMKSLPESPNWLFNRGRIQEAEEAWQRINSEQSFTQLLLAQDETRELSTSARGLSSSYRSVDRETGGTTPSATNDGSTPSRTQSPAIRPTAPGWMGMIPQYIFQLGTLLKQFMSFVATTMTSHRPQAYIALFLAIAQQLCGQTNVLSYAPLIFASLEQDKDAGGYVGGATLLIGLVKFLVTVLVIWKIEQVGRRVLLIAGIIIIAIGLSLLLIAFGGLDVENVNEEDLENKSSGFILALPGVLLVVSGYSMSFGPLTWLLTSELFPTVIRGRALGASTIVTYAAAAFVTSTFLSAQEMFGASVVFGVYLLVTCAGVAFAYAAIPETKGRSEDEIAADLSARLWWRQHHDTIPPVQSSGTTEMTRTNSTDYMIV